MMIYKSKRTRGPSSTLNHTVLLLPIKETQQLSIATHILQWVSSKYGENAAKSIREHVTAMSEKRQALVALFQMSEETKLSSDYIVATYTAYFSYLDAFIERLNKINNFQRVDGCTRCHNALSKGGCQHSVPPEKGLLNTVLIRWLHTFDRTKSFAICEFLQERVYMLLNLPTLLIKFGRTVAGGSNRAERYALCCADFRRCAGIFKQLEAYIAAEKIADSCRDSAPEVNFDMVRKAQILMLAQANESFYYAFRNDPASATEHDTLASLAHNVADLFLRVYRKTQDSSDIATIYVTSRTRPNYQDSDDEDESSSEEEEDDDDIIQRKVLTEMSRKAEEQTIPEMWRCYGLMMHYYYHMVAVWHHCEARATEHGYCLAQFRHALRAYERQCKMLSNPPKKKRLPDDDIVFIAELSKFFNVELVAFKRYAKLLEEHIELLPPESVVIPHIISSKDRSYKELEDVDFDEPSSETDIPPVEIPDAAELQLDSMLSCEVLFTSCSKTETQFPDWSSAVLQPASARPNSKPVSTSSSSSKPRTLTDEEKHLQRADLWLKVDEYTTKLTQRWGAILDEMTQFFAQNPWALFYMLVYSKAELHLDFPQSFIGSRVSTIAADMRQYTNKLQEILTETGHQLQMHDIENVRLSNCVAKYGQNRERIRARQRLLQDAFTQIQAQLNFLSLKTTTELSSVLFSKSDEDLLETAPNSTVTLRKIGELHKSAYHLAVEEFGRNMTTITTDVQALTTSFASHCKEYEAIWKHYVSTSSKKACSMEDIVKNYFERFNQRLTETTDRFRRESQRLHVQQVDRLSAALTDPEDAARQLNNIECQAFSVFSGSNFEPNRRKLLAQLYIALEKLKWINSQLELCQYAYDIQRQNHSSIVDNYRQKRKPPTPSSSSSSSSSAFVPSGFSTVTLHPQTPDMNFDGDDDNDEDLELYPPLDSN